MVKLFQLFNFEAILKAMLVVLNARQGQFVKGILERDSNVLDSNPSFQLDCTEITKNYEVYWVVSVQHNSVSFITSKKNLKNHAFVKKETKFEEDGSIIHTEKKVSRSCKTDSRMVFTQDVEGNMKYVINIHTVECQI